MNNLLVAPFIKGRSVDICDKTCFEDSKKTALSYQAAHPHPLTIPGLHT